MKRTVKIADYGYNGEGVGKIDGKVCFVPKTIIGENVEVNIDKENSKFCKATVCKILQKSEKRIEPRCPYYLTCGGCNFQHLTYEDELEIKKKTFLKEFSKIQKLEDVDIIKSEKDYGYRNKIRLAVKQKTLGFYQEGTKNFVQIDACLLGSKMINNAIRKVSDFLKNTTHIFKEIVFMDFEHECLIDFLTDEKVDIDEMKKAFDCKIEINHIGDYVSTQNEGLSLVYNGEAFRQVNDIVAQKMYKEVLTNVEGKRVVNTYSGAGVLSALLCQKADAVYGIEINQSAYMVAERLKKSNEIKNMTNICGDSEKEIGKIKNLDCVVIDPPRAGCSKGFLDGLLSKSAEIIIYISCNISTFVRDLKCLKEKYFIEKIKLFDMFPRTANFESFAVLKRK